MEDDAFTEGVREEVGTEKKSDRNLGVLDMFNSEPVGMSSDSSDQNSDQESEDSFSDSSDDQVANDCELSKQIMQNLFPANDTNKEDDSASYNFTEEDGVKLKKSKTDKLTERFCCNNLCSNQEVSMQFKNKMEEMNGKPKAKRKQFLLDHLMKQEELNISTSGFQFYGFFFCKKSFVVVSGLSNYLVDEACKAYENGQTVFSHGNTIGMRETEATFGFITWMKHHAVTYGNQAPDEECIILSSCYMQKDLYEQYEEEAPNPHIARSTFYRLFKMKFGPYREDRSLPHIRISSYSSHSQCDTCILLEKFRKTCKKEEDLALCKSMMQSHKVTFQGSYQAIQEKRFAAIRDPENHLNIQGTELNVLLFDPLVRICPNIIYEILTSVQILVVTSIIREGN